MIFSIRKTISKIRPISFSDLKSNQSIFSKFSYSSTKGKRKELSAYGYKTKILTKSKDLLQLVNIYQN